MKDDLGNRMKSFYEDKTRFYLCRKTNHVLRIDGKAFHSYTKGLNRPFDEDFIADMNETAKFLCSEIQGAKIGYVQSDEISIWFNDENSIDTDLWFNGNIQKIASVSASITTCKFNTLRSNRGFDKPAYFDARVFTIPSLEEVVNYFIWRQNDAVRNSICSVAQSLYSHKELHGKNQNDQQELIFQKGLNWNDFPSRQKRGSSIRRINGIWTVDDDTPIFTSNRDYIRKVEIMDLKTLMEEGERNRKEFEKLSISTRIITADDLKFRCR